MTGFTIPRPYSKEIQTSIEKLRDNPDHFSLLIDINRKIYAELTKQLENEDYAYLSLLRIVFDDLLKNSFEDDCVDSEALKTVVVELTKLLLSIQNDNPADKWNKLNTFFNAYNKLLFTKKYSFPTIELDGFRFFWDNRIDKILLTDSDENYHIFPDIDCILSDPESATRVLKKFEIKLKTAVDKYDLDRLCFIEKRKGPVGAMLLQPVLTSKFDLPSYLYRAGYIDTNSKIKGSLPLRGDKVAIIYDIANSGNGLIEAIRFLYDNFRAEVKCAIVFFDYERKLINEDTKEQENEAETRLQAEGVELISVYKKSDFLDKNNQIREGETVINGLVQNSEAYF